MKKIFVIDWWLVPVFVVTVFSGFGLHMADSHEAWHNWAVCHTLAGIVFAILGIMHVQTHWGWYKNLMNKGLGKKSRVTAWLSLIFFMTAVTGFLLLGIEGADSSIGHWHYLMGIILTIIGLWHFIKRFPILRKSVGK